MNRLQHLRTTVTRRLREVLLAAVITGATAATTWLLNLLIHHR